MNGYRCPPAAKIAAFLNLDDATARLVRRVLKGQTDPADACEATAAWVRSCYHDPPWAEQAQHAADALTGGHGIEAVTAADSDAIDPPVFTYSNSGFTYGETIVFHNGRALLTSMGDMVESMERQGVTLR